MTSNFTVTPTVPDTSVSYEVLKDADRNDGIINYTPSYVKSSDIFALAKAFLSIAFVAINTLFKPSDFVTFMTESKSAGDSGEILYIKNMTALSLAI